jgi:hypothetical protein
MDDREFRKVFAAIHGTTLRGRRPADMGRTTCFDRTAVPNLRECSRQVAWGIGLAPQSAEVAYLPSDPVVHGTSQVG